MRSLIDDTLPGASVSIAGGGQAADGERAALCFELVAAVALALLHSPTRLP